MTQEDVNPTSRPPAGSPRKTPSWIGRVLAIVIILAATVAIAHFLGTPPSQEGGPSAGGAASGAARPKMPSSGETPAHAAQRANAQDALRQMVGILMNAADQPGPYQDPLNQDPVERRKFLADRFGVPHEYPRSGVPEDLVPPQAEVLLVLNLPEDQRMTLVRIKDEIGPALSQIYNQYAGQGWKTPDPLVPERQTDEGWLVRFTRGGEERIVYARPRKIAGETLVAIFDAPH
jgi:hypothetical protein